MDVSCAAPAADPNSSEGLSFEVPITNLKLESSEVVDILYVMNKVSEEIEALDRETTNTSANDQNATKTPLNTIMNTDAKKSKVLKEAKSADDVRSVNVVIDDDDDTNNRNKGHKEIEVSIILDVTEESENKVSEEIVALDHETTNTLANDQNATKTTLTTIINTDAKKSKVLKEAKSADDVGSVNVVIDDDDDAKNINKGHKEREVAIVLDVTEETENSSITKKIQLDEKETETDIVLDDITSNSIEKDVRKTDKSLLIDLDETESNNVAVLNDNKSDSDVIVLESNETNPDVIVLETNETTSDVIVLDGNKTDSETTIICDDVELQELTTKYPTHPIVIDEDKDNDCSIVEASLTKSKKQKLTKYDEIYKENSLFVELIEKCLHMENTDGMNRVINRTLLAIYKDLDEEYKKSNGFREILTATIMHLDIEPKRKFSHLKNLCDELKIYRVKKRVPFITLKRGDEDKGSTSSIPSKKRRVETVIDLDDEKYDINKQNKPTQAKDAIAIEIDDSSDDNDVILLDHKDNSNKKNKRKKKKLAKTPKKRGRPRIYRDDIIVNHSIHRKSSKNRNQLSTDQDISSTSHTSNASKQIHTTNIDQDDMDISSTDPDSLLKPRDTSNVSKQIQTMNIDQDDMDISSTDPISLLKPRGTINILRNEIKQQKIRNITTQIALLQSRIEMLEEAEVTSDDYKSPYVRCQETKRVIVNQYKELCQLTGTEATKRHEVRLHVNKGHEEGPVRCLEEFLNANIDEGGNPPFPDWQDVLQCVFQANNLFNLQWGIEQVMNEALALFTQFGRSLQKRRQNREYKSLMALVKEDAPDPAVEDPVLLARLTENARIGKRNEEELLEKYVDLEYGLSRKPNSQLRLSQPFGGLETPTPQFVTGPSNLTHLPPENSYPASYIGTSTAENISEPHIPNVICTDNLPPPSQNIFQSFGSSVTVSDGNIVIEPTIKYGLEQPQETINVRNSEFSLYLSEFQSYINKSQDKKRIDFNKLVKLKTVSEPISAHNYENTKNLRNSQESSDNVQSTNADDLANAAKLAKDILSQVQKDLFTDNKATVENNVNKTNQHTSTVERLSPIIKLTNLHTLMKTEECSTIKVNNSNLELEQNDKSVNDDGFNIFSHTTKYQSVNVTHSNKRVPEDNNDITTEKSCVSEESKEIMDNVEETVKPEPLDIPGMLEDLGKGFTATIFDVEDPFLVIEISDSSESEDDDL